MSQVSAHPATYRSCGAATRSPGAPLWTASSPFSLHQHNSIQPFPWIRSFHWPHLPWMSGERYDWRRRNSVSRKGRKRRGTVLLWWQGTLLLPGRARCSIWGSAPGLPQWWNESSHSPYPPHPTRWASENMYHHSQVPLPLNLLNEILRWNVSIRFDRN